MKKLYQCDCCARIVRRTEQCWTSCGLETWACAACRGEDEEEAGEEEVAYPPLTRIPRCA
jgi:hypothetical protein